MTITVFKEGPILERANQRDPTKRVFWRGWAEVDDSNRVFLCGEWGHEHGEQQVSRREITAAGREDSIRDKAAQQVDYKTRCKMEKEGYKLKISDAEPPRKKVRTEKKCIDTNDKDSVPLVMLAKTMDMDKLEKLDYPLMAQPKIDGFRCLVFRDRNGRVQMYSRTREIFHGMASMKARIAALPIWTAGAPGSFGSGRLYLDGELFEPGISFQSLSSKLRKGQNRPDFDCDGVGFQVFDCFDLDHPTVGFADRISLLRRGLDAQLIQCLDVRVVNNAADVHAALVDFLAAGHEGAMVRWPTKPYQFRVRSSWLQKVKEMQDDEFEVIGFKEGEGSCKNMAVWECVRELPDKTRVTFSVLPGGDREANKAMFLNAPSYIGRRLTVQYFSFYDSGRPRFPTGKGFRESFDLES